jgi:DNA invertase Pin-like site-specific DNA recombinase
LHFLTGEDILTPFSNMSRTQQEQQMATFGYTRVSTKEQTVENQHREIVAAGHQVEFWFDDEGVSGKVPAMQRPQFAKMLGQIRDGETLVVTKLDRLGRDAQDVSATIKHLAARRIPVVVLQLGGVDLASPAGKMMLTMLGAVAEMERDLLVERTHSGLERAKAQGKVLGRPAKTTDEQRNAIKAAHGAGTSISALAREYEISRASILAIVR